MIELVEPVLGFVSASLVALIALGFGAMAVFFSGSALLVFGQFLPFVRPIPVAATAAALAGAVVLTVGLVAGSDPVWLPALVQLACTALAWACVRVRALHAPLRWVVGPYLLVSAALWLAAFAVPALEWVAVQAVQWALLLLLVGATGLWPLVLVGLAQHARERPVEWFVSLRYLTAKRRQTFISVITVICVTGVALGVAVITVVISVMNGFSLMWEEKIIGARAHLVVQSRAGPTADYEALRQIILQVPGVEGATPFLSTDAILRGERGDLQAIVLKGIDPATAPQATHIAQDLVAGELADLETGDGPPGVILGVELADRYFLRVGDEIVLISPLGGPATPLGPAPRMLKFAVTGIFRSEFFQFDESFAYTSLASAQRFMKLDDVVTGIEVRTDDAYRSQMTSFDIEATLGAPYYARDWKTFFPGFFQALKTERVMMFVLLSFIMVVAGFIIISTLIMMIMEKSRDIAILKTMGCTDDGILRVFAIQGVLIGVGGLALGLGMGLVITWNLTRIQAAVEGVLGIDALPASVYQLQQLPYDIVPLHLVLISMIALVLSIGATLLPSWQASRLDPAEALRYE
jgi:lipoprotein-releasing system permease protein